MAIASTFAGEAFYAWWDPSDLSTLFQDTGATIPVTGVGQPVARVNDKSGNGFHYLQPTNGKRPTLQQDGSGRYFIRNTSGQMLRTVNGALNRPVLSYVHMAKITWSAFCTLAGFPAYPTQHSPNYFQFFLGTHSDYGRGACRLDSVAVSSPASNFYSPGTTQVYEFHSADGKAYTDRVERMSISPATVIYPRAVPFMHAANGADQEVLVQDWYGSVLLGRNMTEAERESVYEDLLNPPAAGYTFALGAGSFGSEGQPVGLLRGRLLALGAAAFSLAGQSVGLLRGRNLSLGAGAFGAAGQPVALRVSRQFSLQPASFALSGKDVGVLASRYLPLASGDYAVAGQDIAFGQSKAFPLSAGGYAASGQPMGMRVERRLALQAGAYAVSGQPVSLRRGRRLALEAGSFAIEGQPIDLRKPVTYVFPLGVGEFLLSGKTLSMTTHAFMPVPPSRIVSTTATPWRGANVLAENRIAATAVESRVVRPDAQNRTINAVR